MSTESHTTNAVDPIKQNEYSNKRNARSIHADNLIDLATQWSSFLQSNTSHINSNADYPLIHSSGHHDMSMNTAADVHRVILHVLPLYHLVYKDLDAYLMNRVSSFDLSFIKTLFVLMLYAPSSMRFGGHCE